MNIMEGLMEYDSDMKLRGALAERWEVSADGKTYKFYLRGGIKWSDGKALRAQDFVDSWQRLLDPKNKSSYAKLLSAVTGVKAINDSLFEVKLARAVPYFLHLPTFWVTFPIRMDAIRAKKVVTLGPYLLDKWERGKKITLTKNPGYLGFVVGNDPARLPESVEAIIEPNDAKARKLFHDGKLDVLINATTADLLAEGKTSRLEQFPYLATYYLGFNVRRVKDAQLRKALAQAIDRDQIPSIMQGGQTAARGWVPPGIEGHGDKQSLTGTLYESRGILSKAGYPEGKGFPRLSLWVEKFDGSDRLAEFLIAHFKERLGIGIDRAKREKDADLFCEALGGGLSGSIQLFSGVFFFRGNELHGMEKQRI
jgi:oligopeptide transport system substrate-binding protein